MMDAKKNLKALWGYLSGAFEPEEIEEAVAECMEGFEFDPAGIDALPEEDARGLLFDLGYIALNGLFGGDWGTWDEVLRYSLEFDEETIELMDF